MSLLYETNKKTKSSMNLMIYSVRESVEEIKGPNARLFVSNNHNLIRKVIFY